MRAIILAAIIFTAGAAKADDLPTLDGHYRLLTLPGDPDSLLVVDTKTARFWRLQKLGNQMVFLPIPYLSGRKDADNSDTPPETTH